MKKISVLLLIITIAAVITGCNTSKDSKATDSPDVTETPASGDAKESGDEGVTDASAVTAAPTVTTEPTETAAPAVTTLPTVTAAAAATPATDASGTAVLISEVSTETVEIDSTAIANNLIGDKSIRKLYIYLPPSYNDSDKSYPVVYFLHGYGDSCGVFMNTYKNKLDEEFSKGAKEFILVALDGNNQAGGSFYVNSPISGNWEDFVTNEIVTYMDNNYRTIPDSASRGIMGYSMGGFGALYLALRHPGVYNSTMVFCPGVFAENELDKVLQSWRSWADVKVSYARAFSPDVKNTTQFGNIIQDSDIEEKNQIWKDWMNGYSNWGQKLDDYLTLEKPLKAIKIAYSDTDMFKWIPSGCSYLMKLMDDRGITYTSDMFNGGHIVPPNAVEDYFIPFFGENLAY